VNRLTDQQLLHDYAERQAEPAFAELVRRHVDLVYSAALRMVRDPHSAEDVTQSVFAALAKNAGPLAGRPVLSGWLHRTAQNLAANIVRSDVRRRAREQEAAAMNELLAAGSDATWEHIEPELDAVLGELSEPDRDALLLRYFERKSAREMAETLGTSEDAAQKRVTRAVERSRELFARRGVAVSAGSLIAVISANAVQAAPAGLALTISAATVLAGTALFTTTTATTAVTAAKAIAMTTLQKTLVTATVAILAGVGIYEARQAAGLRNQVQTLHQDQLALMEQMEHLKDENAALSNSAAQTRQSANVSQAQSRELLRLRGNASLNFQELAQLKDAVAQGTLIPESLKKDLNSYVASAITQEKRYNTNVTMNRLNRMSNRLKLAPEQRQSIRDVLLANSGTRAELEIARFTGRLSLEEIKDQKDKMVEAEDQAVTALLDPDQVNAYAQLKAEDAVGEAKAWISFEKATMRRELNLSEEQTERIATILLSLKPGEGGPGITYYSNAREQLEIRLRAFESVLNPDQLRKYRQMKMEDIEQHIQIPKIFKALNP
jgi:RNA polymerase sigma factor (sigma-70 family)